MLKGTISVFLLDTFYPMDQNYRAVILDKLTNYAAECEIGKEYNQVCSAIMADYPQVQLKNDGDLDTFFFHIFDEGFPYSFEEAVKIYKNYVDYDAALAETPSCLEIARLFHQAGCHYASLFKAKYHPFFEKALEANLYAPNVAFLQGCDLAGLPVDQWAKDWPWYFEDIGYELQAS